MFSLTEISLSIKENIFGFLSDKVKNTAEK